MAFASPEIARDYYARYRVENKDKIRERDKAFREANKERLKASRRQYRKDNREAILARQKAYRDSDAGKQYHADYTKRYLGDPAQRMAYLAKGAVRRAKKHGLPHETQIVEHLRGLAPEYCACCGKKLDYSIGNGINVRSDSPSIDRFIPAQGYVIANVRIICMRCNDLKRDATLGELETVVNYMRGLVANRDHVSAQIILGRAVRLQALTSPVTECVV